MYPCHQITTKYLYVSRRSTLLPSLIELEKEEFKQVFRQNKELSVHDFLYTIGFADNEITEICDSSCVSVNDYISDSDGYKTLEVLKKNKTFQMMYEKRRLEENKMFCSYIHQLVGDSDKVLLIDVGWKGTIQDNIRQALSNDIRIFGFYFGLNEDTERYSGNDKDGLIFDINKKTYNYDIFSYSCVQIERVFAANHGQTIGYKSICGSIKPILSDNKEDIEIYDYVKTRQMQMNDTIIDILNAIKNSNIDIEKCELEITDAYLAFLMKNMPKNYQVFLDFRTKVRENFGNISRSKVKIGNSIAKDKEEKKKFYYVDYIYRAMDKAHLKILYPIADIYCELAYLIKRCKIKKCNTEQ